MRGHPGLVPDSSDHHTRDRGQLRHDLPAQQPVTPCHHRGLASDGRPRRPDRAGRRPRPPVSGITFTGSSTSRGAPSASRSPSLPRCPPCERRWAPSSVPCARAPRFPFPSRTGCGRSPSSMPPTTQPSAAGRARRSPDSLARPDRSEVVKLRPRTVHSRSWPPLWVVAGARTHLPAKVLEFRFELTA
jgi:hypothetical protein